MKKITYFLTFLLSCFLFGCREDEPDKKRSTIWSEKIDMIGDTSLEGMKNRIDSIKKNQPKTAYFLGYLIPPPSVPHTKYLMPTDILKEYNDVVIFNGMTTIAGPGGIGVDTGCFVYVPIDAQGNIIYPTNDTSEFYYLQGPSGLCPYLCENVATETIHIGNFTPPTKVSYSEAKGAIDLFIRFVNPSKARTPKDNVIKISKQKPSKSGISLISIRSHANSAFIQVAKQVPPGSNRLMSVVFANNGKNLKKYSNYFLKDDVIVSCGFERGVVVRVP